MAALGDVPGVLVSDDDDATELPPLLSGPALEPGPLWVKGKRRPGASRWGYDPAAPALEVVPQRKRWLYVNERARRHWRALETLDARKKLHPELLKRRRGGDRKFLRRDLTVWHFRLLQMASVQVDPRNNEVGAWTGEGLVRLNLMQLALQVGCPFTPACSRRRSGAPVRIERLLRDCVDAGLIYRREMPERQPAGNWESREAVFKVTLLFWLVSRAKAARDSFLKLRAKRKLRRELAAERLKQGEDRAREDERIRADALASWREAVRATADGGPELVSLLARRKRKPPD